MAQGSNRPYTLIPLVRIEVARQIVTACREYDDIPALAQSLALFPSNLARVRARLFPEYPLRHLLYTTASVLPRENLTPLLWQVSQQLSADMPINTLRQGARVKDVLASVTAQFRSLSSVDSMHIHEQETGLRLVLIPGAEQSKDTGLWFELLSIFVLYHFVARLLGHDWLPVLISLRSLGSERLLNQVEISAQQLRVGQQCSFIELPWNEATARVDSGARDKPYLDRGSPREFTQNLALACMPYLGERVLNLGQCAAICGLSRRTLQRKLKQEGSSLRTVLESLYVEYAQARLSRFSVEAIAVQLGYTSASSFIRMYKRQTGTTPRQQVSRQ